MPTIIKHGDFTFDDEKIYEIAKNIEVVNKQKAFLGQFFSPNAAINGDRLTKRRQVLLDPTGVANLNEGQTPRKDSIKLVTWSQVLRSYGSYIEYTRQAYKKNRDSIIDMARRQLSRNRLYDIEQTRFAALNGATHSISYSTSYWKTFSNAKIMALKNRVSGKLIYVCTPETASAIVDEARAANSLLQGTAEGANLVKNGYLGDYNGVHIVECAEPYMYVPVYWQSSESGATGYVEGGVKETKHLAFFIGHTEDGMWPLVENRLGEGNIEVISKEIGSAGTADPTNEKGTIASRIDDVGAFLEHPECVFKMEIVASVVAGHLPDDYYLESKFVDVYGVDDKVDDNGVHSTPKHEYGQGVGLHGDTETVDGKTKIKPVASPKE